MPWPNRLGDGRYVWAGQDQQTALTEPEQHNAIHGLVRWSPWTVADQTPAQLRLEYRLYPQPGWPWILDMSVTYGLSGDGLEVRTSVVNLPGGAGTCPFGVGWHPYLAAFGGVVDDALLTVPASTAYQADGRGLPLGTHPVGGGEADFRERRQIGAARLDTAFTDLSRDADGRAVVELTPADGSSRFTRLWMDEAYTHVMVFSGDTLPESEQRRGLAVEPMTCAPDMLRNGFGQVLLEEGETFEAVWGLVAGG
jgi:aldose 1-epimerase